MFWDLSTSLSMANIILQSAYYIPFSSESHDVWRGPIAVRMSTGTVAEGRGAPRRQCLLEERRDDSPMVKGEWEDHEWRGTEKGQRPARRFPGLLLLLQSWFPQALKMKPIASRAKQWGEGGVTVQYYCCCEGTPRHLASQPSLVTYLKRI